VKIFLGGALIVVCTICANLLLKLGASVNASERVFFNVFGWKTVFGLCMFGIGGVLYAWILKWLPLHVAQVIAAAQFVGVILASWLVLSEQISTAQWLGITLIAAGIAITGWSYRVA
jgi:drug/metabolite transporter (DMT)-like permease